MCCKECQCMVIGYNSQDAELAEMRCEYDKSHIRQIYSARNTDVLNLEGNYGRQLGIDTVILDAHEQKDVPEWCPKAEKGES